MADQAVEPRQPGPTSAPPEEFWVEFQKLLGYSDEELAAFRKDPHRARVSFILGSPAVTDWTMVFEVEESHGCANGLKPGDKLYFTASGLLDVKRSSPWCAFALNHIPVAANSAQTLAVNGLDPTNACYYYFGCMDCGSKHSWGMVTIKVYWIKEPGADEATRATQEEIRARSKPSA